MAATPPMLQHSRRRDSLKPGAAVSVGLYLRLVCRSSEMHQRPEAVTRARSHRAANWARGHHKKILDKVREI